MKKVLSVFFAAVLLFSASSVFADVELRLSGQLYSPEDGTFSMGPGGSVGLIFSPITVRSRDTVNFGVTGTYTFLNASNIVTMNMFDGAVSAGYNCRFNDRLSAGAELYGGIWAASSDTVGNASGYLLGGRGLFNFYMLPEMTLSLFAGYRDYGIFNYEPLSHGFEAGIMFHYNFSKGLSSSSATSVSLSDDENGVTTEPLFPVFYSRYADHSFGSMTFINNEKNDISDVEVFVYIEQFMSNPDSSAKIDYVKRGESFTAELTGFLNENILNTLMAKKVDAMVIVKYRSLGKLMSSTQYVELTALSRNSMTWQDDRAAAAFISGHDASASSFAKQVKSIVSAEISSSRPENPQLAAAFSGALRSYGLNYVVDPSSAFVDNIGTASVDFLKFPYQTLLYRGGDCDDLTILYCSLFEAVGIDTAMITVPGHIFMAFDSGVSESEKGRISDGNYILQNGKVWIPMEVTLCQESFASQRQTAMKEWKKFKEERALIPLKDAWNEYKPVGIPESDVKIEMPSKAEILKAFRNNNN